MRPRMFAGGFGAAALALLLVISSAALGTAASRGAVRPATAPANDDFSSAHALSVLPYNAVVDVTDATTEVDEPLNCSTSGQTVWYRYDSTSDGLLGIDTRGSNFTTVITAYTGSALNALSEERCASQENGNAADLILQVSLATTYYIQVGVYNNNADGRSLHVHAVLLSPPGNDGIKGARIVNALPYLGSVQDNRGATTDVGDPPTPCQYGMSYTVWYQFSPTKTQTVRVDNLLGDFHTTIAIFRGVGGTLDSCASYSSNVAFHAVIGETYYIMVGGGYEQYGNVRLRVRAAAAPSNDGFASPRSLGSVPTDLKGKTTSATLQSGEPTTCQAAWFGSTVWYSIKPTATSNYRFDSTSNFYEHTAIYSGSSLGGLSLLGCGGTVVARLAKNHVYRIAVGGGYGENGKFDVKVSKGAAPANDRISHATILSLASPFLATVNTKYASNEPGEPDPSCTDLPAGTVWYKYTAPSSGVVRVQTLGSHFDTVVGVYTGTPASLTEVGCDDDSHLPNPDYYQSSFAFQVSAGTAYWVQIGGYGTLAGHLKVQIQRVTPPTNDAFANATVVADGFSQNNVETSKATVEAGEPASTCDSGVRVNGGTLWYAFHASTSNQLTFTATDVPNDRVVTVFSGTDINALTPVSCDTNNVSWTPVAGTDYRIQVAGYGGDIALMDLSFSVAP